MRRLWRKQLLFAINQIRGIEGSQFKSMTMRDRIGRAGLDTVSAENAAVVVNVVNLGVTLGPADAVLTRILRRLDVDAICRTIRGAQEARYALLQPVLIALQHVRAAETLLKTRPAQRTFAIRIVLDHSGLEHLLEGDTHALGNGGNVLEDGHT